jgi:hypothetical protein
MIHAFLAGVEAIRSGIDTEALTRALEARDQGAIDVALATDTWPEKFDPLGAEIRAVFIEGGQIAARQLRRRFREGAGANGPAEAFREIELEMDVDHPHAQEWIREHAAAKAQGFGVDMIQAVRDVIEGGFVEGRAPAVMAREIVGLGLGLTARDLDAVARFRGKLEASGAANVEARTTK